MTPSSHQPFTTALPKLELHTHLNGSIRRSTLSHLASVRSIDPALARIVTVIPSTLSDAFSVFSVIHACVTTLADVERIAFELGEDLERDGVVYAEIRTTPRCMEGRELDGYVRAVSGGGWVGLGWVEKYTEGGGNVVLKLMLSIDRARHSAEEAEEVVNLALEYQSAGVVGIDLSGNPTRGDFRTFIPALTRARSSGLKVTLHAGEIPNRDSELSSMLNFHPDRFGHCCFVSPSNLDRLRASTIPIELCLTSNTLSNSVASFKDYHFGLHYAQAKGTICCISTDDSGVFGSSLSNEYALLMESFDLDERETFELAKRVLQATFLDRDGEVWKSIEEKFDAFEEGWDW